LLLGGFSHSDKEKQQKKVVSYPVRKASAACDQAVIELPDHLVRLPGAGWSVWRCVGMRGAGFPAEKVLKLASIEAAIAADQLLDAEEDVQQARHHVLKTLTETLDALKSDPQLWQEQHHHLLAAAQQIQKRRRPSQAHLPPEVQTLCNAVDEAIARTEKARGQFLSSFKESSSRLSVAIQDIARDEYFREAVTWQNHKALQGSIDALVKMDHGENGRGAERRKREMLVASYLQRYCVKNDTIGFFGPVGWASLSDHGPAIVAKPGSSLLATRKAYFEGWCIDAIAENLARNVGLRPWMIPRRMPYLRLDGITVHLPLTPPFELDAKSLAVIEACDGERPAYSIASQLVDRNLDFKDLNEVYDVLDQLSRRKLISWTLEVPVELHPEQTLWRLLDHIKDESLRKEAQEPLVEMENARDGIALAAGNAGELHRALCDLESRFTSLTNTPAARAAGEMYAARTLVYEDCRRDIAVEIGPDLLEALGPPLSLLLHGARWLTFEAAARFQMAFKAIYDDIARKTGSPVVEAISLWYVAQPLFFNDAESPIASLLDDFRKRWDALLALHPDQKRVSYTTDALRLLVESEFEAPQAGWSGACHHSPDVMIRAVSEEAIRQGAYEFVLGELHVAANTLKGACWIAQHPAPEELFRAFEYDLPRPRLVPLAPKQWPGLTARTQNAFLLSKDYGLIATPDSYGVSPKQAMPIASLVIEQSAKGLMMRTRDGVLQFDLVDVMGDLIAVAIVNSFSLTPLHSHSPRINIEKLVVARETWRFAVADLPFIHEKETENRFLAVRRWARLHGLPRFVFVRTPVEVKPYYLDFDSVIYVENFVRAARRTLEQRSPEALITVVEMLPEPDRLWLPDAQDRRYTSELRIVAVDPQH
jgi:hypothetical protein